MRYPQVVRAGDLLHVLCTIEEDGIPLQQDARVVLNNDPPLNALEGRLSVVLEKVGHVDVVCQTADGAIRDPEGVRVEVVPGDIAVIETAFERTHSPRGGPCFGELPSLRRPW